MKQHNILLGYLQLNFIQMAISQCMVYEIPPQSFLLPWVPPEKTPNFSVSAGIAENGPTLKGEYGTVKANATAQVAEDNFFCCHWNETYINCFAYTAEMEAKAFSHSKNGTLTSQLIDSVGNVQFWTKENTAELFCTAELSTKSPYVNEDFTVNLLYVLTDVSLEHISTKSLKDNLAVSPCNAAKDQKYECQIPSIKLNHTYIMWLKITNGVALLQSPLMSVNPIDIVKPEPPLHLQSEMEDKGQLKVHWSRPASKSYAFQYEVKCFSNSSKNVWQVTRITMEMSLIINNTLIDSSCVVRVRCKSPHGPGLWSDWSTPYNTSLKDVNISIICETYGDLQKMTCRWSTSADPLILESTLLLRYYRSDVYCSESPTMASDADVKECHSQKKNSYECIFKPFYLFSGYTMWIEVRHSFGTVTSKPVCILPKEVVKPFSPSSIKAEITGEVGMLNVSWNNPEFPKSDLQFQIRYAISGTEINWEEVSTPSVNSASIDVQDPCAIYIVQVRCSMIDGAGYWSEWSRPAYTVVKDIKAPLRGPEFWITINEDRVRNQKNVALFWKPLMKNLSLCSVLDYRVEHNTSENITWSDYVENDTTYAFAWAEEVHTIKVVAINSVGTSSVNFILTLSQQMSTVNTVKSFSVYPVNNSCAFVSWTLVPVVYSITSLVIEWRNLDEESFKWIMVPSNLRKYHILDNFILIEKYRFNLYPISSEGVMKPTVTYGFSKGDPPPGNFSRIYFPDRIFLM